MPFSTALPNSTALLQRSDLHENTQPRPARAMRFTPLDMSALLTLKIVSKVYADNTVALSNVSFTITRGTTLAVVGESGSGKTSLARLIVGLESPSDGHITFPGSAPDEAHRTGRHVQLVQQDPTLHCTPAKPFRKAFVFHSLYTGYRTGILKLKNYLTTSACRRNG